MKELKEFLCKIRSDELNKTLFRVICENIEQLGDMEEETISEILEEEIETFECGNIISLFLDELGLNLDEFGFEKSETSDFGYEMESESESNTETFEALFEDINEFVSTCAGIAFENDGVLEACPILLSMPLGVNG